MAIPSVVFTDTYPLWTDINEHKIELPETVHVAASHHRNIKKRPALNTVCVARARYLVRKSVHLVDLVEKEENEGICFLDLFYKLAWDIIHFLLGGNDAKHVDDKDYQYDHHQI